MASAAVGPGPFGTCPAAANIDLTFVTPASLLLLWQEGRGSRWSKRFA
jgi:hypothetical protein